MSSQSMKYHELPSLEMLVAYQKGTLSAVDSEWIEQSAQSNPMVKAVLDNVASIDYAAVQSISKRTSRSIAATYYSKTGFWSKYGVWIGLSSFAVLLGFTSLFQFSEPESLYQQEKLTALEHLGQIKHYHSVEKSDAVIPQLELKDEVEVEREIPISISDKVTENTETITNRKEKIESHALQVREIENLEIKAIEPIKEEEEFLPDNTRVFNVAAESVDKTVLLSVQQVQILAKTNPDDFNSSSTNNKGNPLQVFGRKSEGRSSYSISDVPKYPGGDVALQNYFTGKLRPIQIQESENNYDKSVMLDLEINTRGKLKDYKVYGELHPEHQKALIQAIEELPRFSKGTESITYSLGIAF